MILDEILAHKRVEVEERRGRTPLAEVRRAAEQAPPVRGLREALLLPGLSVIAEVKRRSPARGVLRQAADPAALAATYQAAGARAISVLTDRRFFDGSDDDLRAARRRVSLPVLRKDFVLDEYQLWEARALGADAVLLIARALEARRLRALLELATHLGMDALVEVHDAAEIEAALGAGAQVIGINNRDLATMQVDLGTTPRLRPLVPPGRTVVSESGVREPADLEALRACGVDAVLVGEALMSAADPAAALQALVSAGRPG